MQQKWGKYSRDLCNSRQMLQATCTPHFIQDSQKTTVRKLTKSCHPLPIFTLKSTILPNVTRQHWVIQKFSTQETACQLYLPENGAQSSLSLDKLKWDMRKGCSDMLEQGKTLRNLIWLQQLGPLLAGRLDQMISNSSFPSKTLLWLPDFLIENLGFSRFSDWR